MLLQFRGNALVLPSCATGSRCRILQERISPIVVLAMRNMYQSRIGHFMARSGLFVYLKTLSAERGAHMDSPASKADIPRFLRAFEGQVCVDDIDGDISQFATFNEFFYRRLKPGARPIAAADQDAVLVSCADCRLMAFASVDDATAFWIKVASAVTASHLGRSVPERRRTSVLRV